MEWVKIKGHAREEFIIVPDSLRRFIQEFRAYDGPREHTKMLDIELITIGHIHQILVWINSYVFLADIQISTVNE